MQEYLDLLIDVVTEATPYVIIWFVVRYVWRLVIDAVTGHNIKL